MTIDRAKRAVCACLLVGLVFVSVGSAGADDAPSPVRLGVGDAHFWTGPYIKRASNGEEGADACRRGRCFRYELAVAERGGRLRVALDYPMGNDHIEVKLRAPSGKLMKPQSNGFFSKEAFVKDATRGTWTVQVIPRIATKTAFRLRAKLERETPASGRRLLAPNLRTQSPFGFTFRTSVVMAAGVTVQGFYNDTCSPDERVENQARNCLRLAVGPQNAGDGPLELRFAPVSDALAGEAPMYQRLHYSDGSTKERRAGSYEYHKTHGHYHFAGFASLRLFKVVDRANGKMVPAGEGHKSGFCFGDVQMNSWTRFIQDRASSARSDCESPTEAYMGLSTGWTDIYDAQTPGNYIEFEGNRDGYYVVRSTVDGSDKILETNERDNTSYAYIRVEGTKIKILERGYGQDPWDPDKQVIVDWVSLLRRRAP